MITENKKRNNIHCFQECSLCNPPHAGCTMFNTNVNQSTSCLGIDVSSPSQQDWRFRRFGRMFPSTCIPPFRTHGWGNKIFVCVTLVRFLITAPTCTKRSAERGWASCTSSSLVPRVANHSDSCRRDPLLWAHFLRNSRTLFRNKILLFDYVDSCGSLLLNILRTARQSDLMRISEVGPPPYNHTRERSHTHTHNARFLPDRQIQLTMEYALAARHKLHGFDCN